MFLHLQGYRGSAKLEQDLQLLGATVEKCFSREVNCVLTNRGCPADYEKKKPTSATSVSVPSPVTPSPFNLANLGMDSPQGYSPGYSPGSLEPQKPLTRGKAMMQAAKSTKFVIDLEMLPNFTETPIGFNVDVTTNGDTVEHTPFQSYGTMDVIEAARAWNLKVLHVERTLPWLKREVEKIPQTSRNKEDCPTAKSQMKVHKLRSPYIKFEAVKCGFKPLYQEFEGLHEIRFESAPWTCPFNTKKQGSKIDERGEGEEEREPQGAPEDIELDASPESAARKEAQPLRRDADDELFGARMLTAGEIRLKQQERKRMEMNCGYCEMCSIKYNDIYKHVYNSRHREFVTNSKNYIALDKMIAEGPNMSQFIHDIVEAHALRNRGDAESSAASSTGLGEVMLLSECTSPAKSDTTSRRSSGSEWKPGLAAAGSKGFAKERPVASKKTVTDIVNSSKGKSDRSAVGQMSKRPVSPSCVPADMPVLSKRTVTPIVQSPTRKSTRRQISTRQPEWQHSPGKRNAGEMDNDVRPLVKFSVTEMSTVQSPPTHSASSTWQQFASDLRSPTVTATEPVDQSDTTTACETKTATASMNERTETVMSAGQRIQPCKSREFVTASGSGTVGSDCVMPCNSHRRCRKSWSKLSRKAATEKTNTSTAVTSMPVTSTPLTSTWDNSTSVTVQNKRRPSRFWFYEKETKAKANSNADTSAHQARTLHTAGDETVSDTEHPPHSAEVFSTADSTIPCTKYEESTGNAASPAVQGTKSHEAASQLSCPSRMMRQSENVDEVNESAETVMNAGQRIQPCKSREFVRASGSGTVGSDCVTPCGSNRPCRKSRSNRLRKVATEKPNTSMPVTPTPVTSTPVTSTPVTSTPVTSTRDNSTSVTVQNKRRPSRFWFYENETEAKANSNADSSAYQAGLLHTAWDKTVSDTERPPHSAEVSSTADSTIPSTEYEEFTGNTASQLSCPSRMMRLNENVDAVNERQHGPTTDETSLTGCPSQSRMVRSRPCVDSPNTKRDELMSQETSQDYITADSEHDDGIETIQSESDRKAEKCVQRLSRSRSNHDHPHSPEVHGRRATNSCTPCEREPADSANKDATDSNAAVSGKGHRNSKFWFYEVIPADKTSNPIDSDAESSAHPIKEIDTEDPRLPLHYGKKPRSVKSSPAGTEPRTAQTTSRVLKVVCPKLDMEEILTCHDSQTAVSPGLLRAFRSRTLSPEVVNEEDIYSGPVRRVRSARSMQRSRSACSTPNSAFARSRAALTATKETPPSRQRYPSVGARECCEDSSTSEIPYADGKVGTGCRQASEGAQCSNDTTSEKAHQRRSRTPSRKLTQASGTHSAKKDIQMRCKPSRNIFVSINKDLTNVKTLKDPPETSTPARKVKFKRKRSLATNGSTIKLLDMSDNNEAEFKRFTVDSKELPGDPSFEISAAEGDATRVLSDAAAITGESLAGFLSQGLDREASSPLPESACITPIKTILGNVESQLSLDVSSTGWDENLDEFLQGRVDRLTTEDGNTTSGGYTSLLVRTGSPCCSPRRTPKKMRCKLAKSPFKVVASPLSGEMVKTPQRVASPVRRSPRKSTPEHTYRTLDFASPNFSLLDGLNSVVEELWVGPTKNEKFTPSYTQKCAERNAQRTPVQRTPVYHPTRSPLANSSTPKAATKERIKISSVKSTKAVSAHVVFTPPSVRSRHAARTSDTVSPRVWSLKNSTGWKPDGNTSWMPVVRNVPDMDAGFNLPVRLERVEDASKELTIPSPITPIEKKVQWPKKLLTAKLQPSPPIAKSCAPSVYDVDGLDDDDDIDFPKRKLLKSVSSTKKRVSLGFMPAYEFKLGMMPKRKALGISRSLAGTSKVRFSNLGRKVTLRLGSATPVSSRSSARTVGLLQHLSSETATQKPQTTLAPVTPSTQGSLAHKEVFSESATTPPVQHKTHTKQTPKSTPVMSEGVKQDRVDTPSSCNSTPHNRQLDKLLSLHSLENLQYLPRRKSSNLSSIVRFHGNGDDSKATDSHASSVNSTPQIGRRKESGILSSVSSSEVTPSSSRTQTPQQTSASRCNLTLSSAGKVSTVKTSIGNVSVSTKGHRKNKFWSYELLPGESNDSNVETAACDIAPPSVGRRKRFWYYEPIEDETNAETDSNPNTPTSDITIPIKRSCKNKFWYYEPLPEETTESLPASIGRRKKRFSYCKSVEDETNAETGSNSNASTSVTNLSAKRKCKNNFSPQETLPDETKDSNAEGAIFDNPPLPIGRRNKRFWYKPNQDETKSETDSNPVTSTSDNTLPAKRRHRNKFWYYAPVLDANRDNLPPPSLSHRKKRFLYSKSIRDSTKTETDCHSNPMTSTSEITLPVKRRQRNKFWYYDPVLDANRDSPPPPSLSRRKKRFSYSKSIRDSPKTETDSNPSTSTSEITLPVKCRHRNKFWSYKALPDALNDFYADTAGDIPSPSISRRNKKFWYYEPIPDETSAETDSNPQTSTSDIILPVKRKRKNKNFYYDPLPYETNDIPPPSVGHHKMFSDSKPIQEATKVETDSNPNASTSDTTLPVKHIHKRFWYYEPLLDESNVSNPETASPPKGRRKERVCYYESIQGESNAENDSNPDTSSSVISFPIKHNRKSKFWSNKPVPDETNDILPASIGRCKKRISYYDRIQDETNAETESNPITSTLDSTFPDRQKSRTKFWYYEPVSDETKDSNAETASPSPKGRRKKRTCNYKTLPRETERYKPRSAITPSLGQSESGRRSETQGQLPTSSASSWSNSKPRLSDTRKNTSGLPHTKWTKSRRIDWSRSNRAKSAVALTAKRLRSARSPNRTKSPASKSGVPTDSNRHRPAGFSPLRKRLRMDLSPPKVRLRHVQRMREDRSSIGRAAKQKVDYCEASDDDLS